MSAWLPPSDVDAIFGGQDLLEDVSELDTGREGMLSVFLSLIGVQEEKEGIVKETVKKPFECVGTREEALCCVGMLAARRRRHRQRDSSILGELVRHHHRAHERLRLEKGGVGGGDLGCATATERWLVENNGVDEAAAEEAEALDVLRAWGHVFPTLAVF